MPILEVCVYEAHNLTDKESVGKSDPYVIVKCEGKKEKTKHIKNELNPHWDETFRFEVKDLAGEVELELWDHNLLKDDDMGHCRVPLGGLRRGVPSEQWYAMSSDKGKGRGEIRVRLNAVDFDGGLNPQNAAATSAAAPVRLSQQPAAIPFPKQQGL